MHRSSSPFARSTPAAGFTLVELLTVVAIGAIIAAAAIPSFNRFVVASRITEADGALRSAIELARSEAVARSVRVGVCRSASANSASPGCTTGASGDYGANDWAVGWLVYAKTDPNVADGFEANDVIVRRQPALTGQSAGQRVMVWGPAATPLVFNWNGVRAAGPVGSFALDFGLATASRSNPLVSNQASCVGVNVVGRLDVSRPVAGACP